MPPTTTERATAYGLELDLGFRVQGLDDGAGGGVRKASVELLAGEELAERWGGGGRAVSDWRSRDGTRELGIDHQDGSGYLLEARGAGGFLVSEDGTQVSCAPEAVPEWRWQLFLAGQTLPFAALLQGLEVFHASAVVVDDGAIAFVAGSGGGKSSVALHLAAGGASFLTDDVLAVEVREGELLAHPGAGAANVRMDAAAELRERGGLGPVLGGEEGFVRMQVERHRGPVPLGALYFLERRSGGGPLAIESAAPVDPRMLLGSTFNSVVQASERLAAQLDLCARLAASVPVFRACVPPTTRAPALSLELERHMAGATRG
jgi:hypothetical protein